ncbi:CoA ester lyase [Rhodococcus opacus]|nr:CoA ester lyase [Rhodococcus opacus]
MVSWLYVPGDRPERFDKAVDAGASVVILDLEDAVDAARKDDARTNVVNYLSEARPDGPQLHVRVNDLATDRGRDDLRALVGLPGLTAVRLPKVESATDLDLLDDIFRDDPTPAYALLESAHGIEHAAEIAHHPRVAGIALGEQDLGAALSITSPAAFDQIRLKIVLVAAAAGLPPIPMSVYPNVKDDDGFRASCAHGRGIGMFGRSAIHPRQVPLIADAFCPSDEEIRWATAVDDAARAAEIDGVGALALDDGQFVDAPIITKARRILALADHLHSARV